AALRAADAPRPRGACRGRAGGRGTPRAARVPRERTTPHPRGVALMTTPVSDELRDLLALHLVPGLGPRRTASLLRHFGSAAAARRASAARLTAVPGIGDGLAGRLAEDLAQAGPDAALARAEQAGVHLAAPATPAYPA